MFMEVSEVLAASMKTAVGFLYKLQMLIIADLM
jgi:hypothetical protein